MMFHPHVIERHGRYELKHEAPAVFAIICATCTTTVIRGELRTVAIMWEECKKECKTSLLREPHRCTGN